MKGKIEKLINKLGYSVVKTENATANVHNDIKETEFWNIYELCKPYTMTSVERMYALYRAALYVLDSDIKGHFVECGVWRGGSSMLIAKMLANRGITNRRMYLYDTFEGMSEPTTNDVDIEGKDASYLLKVNEDNKQDSMVWCLADLTDVKNNLGLTGFSDQNIVYVKGKVEETIPGTIPQDEIALLRLDTDWYESTKHELIHLYPRLKQNGVLIIDDYGHWEGCKKAVDEYLQENKVNILLNRIDYTGRIGIKTF